MNERSLKFALLGSLIVNAFLLGGIAGAAYGGFGGLHARTGAAAQPQQHPLRFAAHDLSADRQEEFSDALKDARRDGRPFARAGRDGRHDVLRLLAAPQLDRAALDAALAHTREADGALRARVEQGVADFAATLSPDERAKFAEGLRENGQWRLPPPPKLPAASQ
ncbi:periplasmic heavy metal sensor [Burkholderia alba]|uniref:periplasmic heavy metal sensor n=1 Tax=Burkholderia alba TaxID=2683677 RepID=UPI002B05CF8C|nr:periplasmic heavy metal sensor [Burkholderia alba]